MGLEKPYQSKGMVGRDFTKEEGKPASRLPQRRETGRKKQIYHQRQSQRPCDPQWCPTVKGLQKCVGNFLALAKNP
jgi:hypothetical protein